MKKLKTILNSKTFLIILFLLALFRFLFIPKFNYPETAFEDTIFKVTQITKKDYGYKLTLIGSCKIMAYYYDEFNFNLGDEIAIKAVPLAYQKPTLENAFDYQLYLFRQGYKGSYQIKEITLIKENTSIFYQLKNLFFKRASTINNPYLYSLLLGDNSYFQEEVKTSFNNNGIIHVFAISGFHITFFLTLLKKLLKRLKKDKIFFILLIFLSFYAFLLNFKVAIMRSIIFHLFLLFNKRFSLSLSSSKVLLIAILSILIFTPLAIYDLGFLYSSIISLAFFLFLKKKTSYFKSLFLTSLLAFFISLPISVQSFNQINIFSIFNSILATVLVSYLLLPLCLLVFILPCCNFLLIFFGDLFSNFSLILIDIFPVTILASFKTWQIILYYLLLILFLLSKIKIKLCCFILLSIFLSWHYFAFSFLPDFYLMLDVGQGDSSLFFLDKQTLVIDTGESKNYYNAKNLIAYLKSLGIRKIDHLVISHGDADHLADAFYLLNNFKVGNIYFNSNTLKELEKELYLLALKKQIKITFLKYQSCFLVSNYQFCNLNQTYDDENKASLVLFANIHNYKFLFTGDIDWEVENFLINKYSNLQVDFLKVAHHGSNTSSRLSFLKKIRPKYSLISVGENNYGHPSLEVLKNLQKYTRSKIFVTREDGSIKFLFSSCTFFTYPP